MPPRYLTLKTAIFIHFKNRKVHGNFRKLSELDFVTSNM